MEVLDTNKLHGSLLAAPAPLMDESRTSWVQRLCGAHQYSEARFRAIVGIKRPVKDWDRDLTVAMWQRIRQTANIKTGCGEANFCLGEVCSATSPENVLLFDNNRPRYRWCSVCLATDPVPYLRWEWRLVDMYFCIIHRVPLDDQCPWCDNPLLGNASVLVSSGSRGGAMNLATCAVCGMPLFERVGDEEPERELDHLAEFSSAFIDMVRELKAAYRAAHQRPWVDFSAHMRHRPSTVSAGSEEPAGVPARSSSAITAAESGTLHITGAVFRFELLKIGLPFRRCLKIERAIQLIRMEQLEQKTSAAQSGAGGFS